MVVRSFVKSSGQTGLPAEKKDTRYRPAMWDGEEKREKDENGGRRSADKVAKASVRGEGSRGWRLDAQDSPVVLQRGARAGRSMDPVTEENANL